jgi:FkbM family methyltransferase
MTFPPDLTFPAQKAVTAQVAAKVIATLTPSRNTVVQAGGCAGLWPLALAQYFEHVYTFEPATSNFQHLQVNVEPVVNIAAYQYALGETHRLVGMTRPKLGAGLWRVDGEGDTLMVTLDEFFGAMAVDALVLDVEGFEADVWAGAERMITTHRPLLWFEYLHHRAAIDAFMSAHGYVQPITGIGGDCYSVHASRRVH